MNIKKNIFYLAIFICVYGSKILSNEATSSLPIVFHPNYDISFFGIEKMHPFDTKKYSKIAQHLQKTCNIKSQDFQIPHLVTDTELMQVHTFRYLKSLDKSATIAGIAEISALRYIPNFLLQRNLLNSMRYATGGTILGAQLALSHGWAINLSGGYHHAKSNKGEGFCFFADIPLAIKKLREKNKTLKVLIVDLDAHQGNGLESILGSDPLTFIFDMYSQNNYPNDKEAAKYIDFNYPLRNSITTEEYITILKRELPLALEKVKPDLVIYNAGSDIYEKDLLGRMSVSAEGIIERDFFLFSQAIANNIPILMVLSGGYSPESGNIIGKSIENILKNLNLLRPSITRPKSFKDKIKLKKLSSHSSLILTVGLAVTITGIAYFLHRSK